MFVFDNNNNIILTSEKLRNLHILSNNCILFCICITHVPTKLSERILFCFMFKISNLHLCILSIIYSDFNIVVTCLERNIGIMYIIRICDA